MALLFRTIIEMLGKPKEHVDQTLKMYVDKLKKDKNFKVKSEFFGEAESREEGLFSSFVELELETESLKNMIYFCIDYMPASIDVLGPEKMTLTDKESSDFLNDLIASLHRIDAVAKNLGMENRAIGKTTFNIISNFIKLALYYDDRDVKELSIVTGLDVTQMPVFLEFMVKAGQIEKIGDKYKLKNG